MPIVIQPSVDVLTLETGHVYAVEGEISTDYNHPINSSFAHLTYEVLGSVSGSNGYKVIKCTDAYSGKKWTRTQRWDAWNDWVPDATATTPQEFDLPLAEGLEPIDPCRYSKDQFGRVLVNIYCNPTTGSVSIGENQSLSIGTLPEGFRPAHYTSNACEVIVGQSRYIGTFDINEYGAITLWTAAPSASIIIGSVLFDTA